MKQQSSSRRWTLVAVIGSVATVWLVVLPRLSEAEMVKRRERLIEQHRIDPAAMFYTDLPLLEAGKIGAE